MKWWISDTARTITGDRGTKVVAFITIKHEPEEDMTYVSENHKQVNRKQNVTGHFVIKKTCLFIM